MATSGEVACGRDLACAFKSTIRMTSLKIAALAALAALALLYTCAQNCTFNIARPLNIFCYDTPLKVQMLDPAITCPGCSKVLFLTARSPAMNLCTQQCECRTQHWGHYKFQLRRPPLSLSSPSIKISLWLDPRSQQRSSLPSSSDFYS